MRLEPPATALATWQLLPPELHPRGNGRSRWRENFFLKHQRNYKSELAPVKGAANAYIRGQLE